MISRIVAHPGLLAALLLWPLSGLTAAQVLLEAGSGNRYLANSSNPGIGTSGTAENFPGESGWNNGSYGIGYETGTGAQGLLQTGKRRQLTLGEEVLVDVDEVRPRSGQLHLRLHGS